MKSFTIELVEGRPILKSDQEVIFLNTGWPTTLQNNREITLLGRHFNCFTTMAGVTLPKLQELLGIDITTLLGMDVMVEYDLILDYSAQSVSFSHSDISFHGETIPLRHIMGVPIIEIIIDGKSYSVYLDTGSKYSYLSEKHSSISFVDAEIEDFFPETGLFTAPTAKMKTTVGKEVLDITFARLPKQLEQAMSVVNVDGVLGSDFFKHYKVLISNKRAIVCLL